MSAVEQAKAGIVAKDIALQDDLTLQVSDGDFVLTSSEKVKRTKDQRETIVNLCDQQHIEDVLWAFKGNYRETPLIGVGLPLYLNGPDQLTVRNELRKKITSNLEYDVFQVRDVRITGWDSISIEATRKKE